MIVNCRNCGKSVSTRIVHCAYCKMEVVSLDLVPASHQPVMMPLKERLKGGILSFVSR